jgi:hypothetical protein
MESKQPFSRALGLYREVLVEKYAGRKHCFCTGYVSYTMVIRPTPVVQ